jgi:flagellar motility protein MotE (MotC chaperone)
MRNRTATTDHPSILHSPPEDFETAQHSDLVIPTMPLAPTLPPKISKPTQKTKPGIVTKPKLAKKAGAKEVRSKYETSLETAHERIASLESHLDDYYQKCERLHKAANDALNYMTGQAGSLHKELAKAKKDLADTQQQLRNARVEKDSKSKALTKANNDYRTTTSKLNTKRDKVYDLS